MQYSTRKSFFTKQHQPEIDQIGREHSLFQQAAANAFEEVKTSRLKSDPDVLILSKGVREVSRLRKGLSHTALKLFCAGSSKELFDSMAGANPTLVLIDPDSSDDDLKELTWRIRRLGVSCNGREPLIFGVLKKKEQSEKLPGSSESFENGTFRVPINPILIEKTVEASWNGDIYPTDKLGEMDQPEAADKDLISRIENGESVGIQPTKANLEAKETAKKVHTSDDLQNSSLADWSNGSLLSGVTRTRAPEAPGVLITYDGESLSVVSPLIERRKAIRKMPLFWAQGLAVHHFNVPLPDAIEAVEHVNDLLAPN